MHIHMYIQCTYIVHTLYMYIIPVCQTGERGAERRGGINDSVTTEVSSVFKGKTVGITYSFVYYTCIHMHT